MVGLDTFRKQEATMVVGSMKASSFSRLPPRELLIHWYPMTIVNFCVERMVVSAPLHLIIVTRSMRV